MLKIKIIKLSEVLKYKVFDSYFFIEKEKAISEYREFLKNNNVKEFLDIVQIEYPKIIKKGDLFLL